MLTICWKSDFYRSSETCSVTAIADGFRIVSHIDLPDGAVVDYELTVDTNWNTQRFRVESTKDAERFAAAGECNTSGRWTIDGREDPAFDACNDIDITATPFTNTLPVKRLDFAVGERRQIVVVYIDLDERTISPQKQQYTHVAANRYRFETVPNDFEAEILFGADGFVKYYPELFERLD